MSATAYFSYDADGRAMPTKEFTNSVKHDHRVRQFFCDWINSGGSAYCAEDRRARALPAVARGSMIGVMKNKTLIELLTAEGKTESQAADDIDRAVERILRRLRNGQVVALPGLGRLVPGPKPEITFELAKRTKAVGGSAKPAKGSGRGHR